MLNRNYILKGLLALAVTFLLVQFIGVKVRNSLGIVLLQGIIVLWIFLSFFLLLAGFVFVYNNSKQFYGGTNIKLIQMFTYCRCS